MLHNALKNENKINLSAMLYIRKSSVIIGSERSHTTSDLMTQLSLVLRTLRAER